MSQQNMLCQHSVDRPFVNSRKWSHSRVRNLNAINTTHRTWKLIQTDYFIRVAIEGQPSSIDVNKS